MGASASSTDAPAGPLARLLATMPCTPTHSLVHVKDAAYQAHFLEKAADMSRALQSPGLLYGCLLYFCPKEGMYRLRSTSEDEPECEPLAAQALGRDLHAAFRAGCPLVTVVIKAEDAATESAQAVGVAFQAQGEGHGTVHVHVLTIAGGDAAAAAIHGDAAGSGPVPMEEDEGDEVRLGRTRAATVAAASANSLMSWIREAAATAEKLSLARPDATAAEVQVKVLLEDPMGVRVRLGHELAALPHRSPEAAAGARAKAADAMVLKVWFLWCVIFAFSAARGSDTGLLPALFGEALLNDQVNLLPVAQTFILQIVHDDCHVDPCGEGHQDHHDLHDHHGLLADVRGMTSLSEDAFGGF